MSGLKAVVIDDDRLNREMVSRALVARGFEAFEAGDAVSGFRMIEQNRPELIVIDVVLPGEIDGVGLCRLIKHQKLCEGSVVVMITASDRRKEADRSGAAGADILIGKPFSPKQFMSQVSSLLKDRGIMSQ